MGCVEVVGEEVMLERAVHQIENIFNVETLNSLGKMREMERWGRERSNFATFRKGNENFR